MRQDHEASEGVVAALRSGGGNVGTQRHYACNVPKIVFSFYYFTL